MNADAPKPLGTEGTG